MFGVTEIVGDHVYSVIIFNLINPVFHQQQQQQRKASSYRLLEWEGLIAIRMRVEAVVVLSGAQLK